MGKIKRERQKFHITAENKDIAKAEKEYKLKNKHLPIPLDAVDNIFSGLNIQLDGINKFDDDTTPLYETKEREDVVEVTVKPSSQTKDIEKPQKHFTKKEKMVLKHQQLMDKLDVTQKARLHSRKMKQKRNRNVIEQTLLLSKSEISSLLTPAAVEPSKQHPEKHPKNVFSVPSLNDDLPALHSIFALNLNQKSSITNGITTKSNSKAKKSNPNEIFVKNYTFLRKAMAKRNNKRTMKQ